MEEVIEQKIKEVRKLIAKAETQKAIEILLDYLESDESLFFFHERAILISSQFYQFNNATYKGTISGNEELNKVNEEILNILKSLNEQLKIEKNKVDKKISELFKRLLFAKNRDDFEKIDFEINLLSTTRPYDYDVVRLKNLVSRYYWKSMIQGIVGSDEGAKESIDVKRDLISLIIYGFLFFPSLAILVFFSVFFDNLIITVLLELVFILSLFFIYRSKKSYFMVHFLSYLIRKKLKYKPKVIVTPLLQH